MVPDYWVLNPLHMRVTMNLPKKEFEIMHKI